MDLNAAVIASLVFGVVSFVILVVYIVTVNYILPNYPSSMPWSTITFYGSILALFLVLPLNITYSSLASTDDLQNKSGGENSATMNTVFIATLMTLLSLVNWLVFYTQYANIGSSASDTAQYLQLMLPANLLLSIVMVSIIITHKFSQI